MELTRYFYTNVLPLYFSDNDILEFERVKVLHMTREHLDNFSTLGDAFKVLTSLQTVISILESASFKNKYEPIFQKNAQTLREYGICFPFSFEQFSEVNYMPGELISVYTKVANSMLV
nr:DUF5365 family protein [Mesobacillus harenae]